METPKTSPRNPAEITGRVWLDLWQRRTRDLDRAGQARHWTPGAHGRLAHHEPVDTGIAANVSLSSVTPS